MKILIKNGRLIDPKNKRDEIADILIENSKVKEISKNIRTRVDDVLIINATNRIVSPGLIDVHVHFREPGFEHKETIKTGSRAAAMGGFTTVLCEPNTQPPIDSEEKIKRVLEIIKRDSVINIRTKVCISKEMAGIALVDIDKVKEAGAVAISDDGHPIENGEFMKKALKKAKNKILVNPHCEESKMRQGRFFPLTFDVETSYIERDLKLNKEIKAQLHVSHLSFKDSVEEIEKAKNDNQPVSAEATPHHFTLSEEATKEYGTNAKVNPPLRTREDVLAIRRGLQRGIIDVIATDHAPHAPEEKAKKWEEAPFGIIGLETSLGLVLTELVHGKVINISDAIAKMTANPARIFGLNCGHLSIGAPADITIIDPFKEWVVDVNKFESKGRNCPFNGWHLKGKAIMTIVNGQIVMDDGLIIEDRESYHKKMQIKNFKDERVVKEKEHSELTNVSAL